MFVLTEMCKSDRFLFKTLKAFKFQ